MTETEINRARNITLPEPTDPADVCDVCAGIGVDLVKFRDWTGETVLYKWERSICRRCLEAGISAILGRR